MTQVQMQTNAFSQYPEFTHLSLSHKKAFEAAIAPYPPLTDLSFVGLMTWWNLLDSCAVSYLNDNLVISYWLPGDDRNSGLCLVGSNRVDESICAVFDHQRSNGEAPRLVHVPEFVISALQYPDMFVFSAEDDYAECILSANDLFPLAQTSPRVKRQARARLRSELSILPISKISIYCSHQAMIGLRRAILIILPN